MSVETNPLLKSKTSSLRVWCIYALKLAVGLAVFLYLAFSGKLESGIVKKETVLAIAILVAIQAVITIFTSWRLQIVTKVILGRSFSVWQMYRIIWAGLFFQTFTPFPAASDLTYYYYLRTEGFDKKVLACSVFNRLVSLASVLALCLTAVLSFQFSLSLWQFGLLVLALNVLAFWAILGGLRFYLQRSYVPVQISFRKGTVMQVLLLSAVAFFLKTVCFTVAFAVWTGSVTLAQFYLAAMGPVVDIFSFTPANLGIGHFLYDAIVRFQAHAEGANVFHIYFLNNIIFQLFGFFSWLLLRKRNVEET